MGDYFNESASTCFIFPIDGDCVNENGGRNAENGYTGTFVKDVIDFNTLQKNERGKKMKLTFLGSGAAEGMPAIFCNCEVCRESRRLGGKNFRTRSQSLINDDLLIDFPADTYSHFQRFGIEGDTIKYLIITHPHQDHFYPNDLQMRTERLAHGKRVPVLKILCS